MRIQQIILKLLHLALLQKQKESLEVVGVAGCPVACFCAFISLKSLANIFRSTLSTPGFPKLAVHGYPLAINQFARVPLKCSHIILKQKICSQCFINPKPRLKTIKKGLLRNLSGILSPYSIEDQK